MYPVIPAVVKAVMVVAAVGGGVVMLKKNDVVKKMKKIKSIIPCFGGEDSDQGVSDPQGDSDLMARNGVNDDLQKRFEESKSRVEEAESRAAQLEMAMKELRSESLKARTELEVMRRKLEEAKQLSFDYFPDLLKWIQKTLGKPEGGASTNIDELEFILSKYGLSVNKDYENIPEGFVCVKDVKVTGPEISLPMLARGDDIELKGIVKVPMSFAGAEPPADYRKEGLRTEAIASDKNGDEIDSSESVKTISERESRISSRVPNESYTPVSEEQTPNHADGATDNAMGEPIALENEEAGFGNDDDFIITTKERTRS